MRVAGLWLRSIRATYECYPKYRGVFFFIILFYGPLYLFILLYIFHRHFHTRFLSLFIFIHTQNTIQKVCPDPKREPYYILYLHQHVIWCDFWVPHTKQPLAKRKWNRAHSHCLLQVLRRPCDGVDRIQSVIAPCVTPYTAIRKCVTRALGVFPLNAFSCITRFV